MPEVVMWYEPDAHKRMDSKPHSEVIDIGAKLAGNIYGIKLL